MRVLSRKLFLWKKFACGKKLTIITYNIRYEGEDLVRFCTVEERGYIMGAKESPPDGMLGDGP